MITASPERNVIVRATGHDRPRAWSRRSPDTYMAPAATTSGNAMSSDQSVRRTFHDGAGGATSAVPRSRYPPGSCDGGGRHAGPHRRQVGTRRPANVATAAVAGPGGLA